MPDSTSTPVLELSTFTLAGAQSFDTVESFDVLGDSAGHHPHSRCFHHCGIELLPDCENVYVAYLFIFTRPRNGHCCPKSFSPFSGSVTFRGDAIDHLDRPFVHSVFVNHPDLFRHYESGDHFFRYILNGDAAERRIGFFYAADGGLDHIMLN